MTWIGCRASEKQWAELEIGEARATGLRCGFGGKAESEDGELEG